ncbi:DUF6443 domain-containing protein, partial [Fulvivirga lutimaris]|uniref:DUF6443 domain-containing protein n=1 Tax=Fulvivirga lutimaris TaxID=1819566 RepID=UPI001626EA8B
MNKLKKAGISVLFFHLCLSGLGQSIQSNYVKTYTAQSAIEGELSVEDNEELVSESVEYYDGLGRVIQRNSKKAAFRINGTAVDIVTPFIYDGFGRNVENYLPYASTLSDGEFVDQSDAIMFQKTFYDEYYGAGTGNYAKAVAVLEKSELARVLEQGSPGEAWQPGGGATVRYEYLTNELGDKVNNWEINTTNGRPRAANNYAPAELYKNVTIDESGNRVIEFVDKLGRTILKRVQAVDSPNLTTYNIGEWADTYYVYDDYGNLRYVLPPESIKELNQVQTLTSEPINYWNFDENEGAILGDLKDNNSGNIHGATWAQGMSKTALFFDGIDDYVEIENSANSHSFIQNNGVFTISMYVKINDLSKRSFFISSTGTTSKKGFSFMYETYGGQYGDRQLRFTSTYGTSGNVNLIKGEVETIYDNLWHHVAVVGDGTNVRFYVDGNADGVPQPLEYYSSGSSSFNTLIGAVRNTASNVVWPFEGFIDEVKVFDIAFNDSEISMLSNSLSQDFLNTWAFQYKYDGRNRMIEKRVPGADSDW